MFDDDEDINETGAEDSADSSAAETPADETPAPEATPVDFPEFKEIPPKPSKFGEMIEIDSPQKRRPKMRKRMKNWMKTLLWCSRFSLHLLKIWIRFRDRKTKILTFFLT